MKREIFSFTRDEQKRLVKRELIKPKNRPSKRIEAPFRAQVRDSAPLHKELQQIKTQFTSEKNIQKLEVLLLQMESKID